LAETLAGGKWSKRVLAATVRPNKDPKVDKEVYERTLEEVAEQKAIGPLSEAEVDSIFGKHWAPARRVGLVQAAGGRPIDDFSEFGHNSASHSHDYVDLGGVDAVVGIAKTWLEQPGPDGVVSITLSSGKTLRGPLHESYKERQSRRLQGRALDLRSACQKQPPPTTTPDTTHPTDQRQREMGQTRGRGRGRGAGRPADRPNGVKRGQGRAIWEGASAGEPSSRSPLPRVSRGWR